MVLPGSCFYKAVLNLNQDNNNNMSVNHVESWWLICIHPVNRGRIAFSPTLLVGIQCGVCVYNLKVFPTDSNVSFPMSVIHMLSPKRLSIRMRCQSVINIVSKGIIVNLVIVQKGVIPSYPHHHVDNFHFRQLTA